MRPIAYAYAVIVAGGFWAVVVAGVLWATAKSAPQAQEPQIELSVLVR
jgi:hypothetical protein